MDKLDELEAATGRPAPERIWLIAMACGEIEWNEHPDPNGDDEPSVGYVRADTLARQSAEQAARVVELEVALKDAADALEKFVDTAAPFRPPYEHPLSAYDRARAALGAS